VNHPNHRPDIEQEDKRESCKWFSQDIKRLLCANSIVIDIGANKGQWAVDLLQIMAISRIYSIEPVPEAFYALRHKSITFPQIKPINVAISKESVKVPFFVTESDVGSSLLKPIDGQPSKWLTIKQNIMVDAVRLDEFILNEGLEGSPIDLVKIDTQGADQIVLESAGIFLSPRQIRAVLVEVSFVDFYHNQSRYPEIIAMLDAKGYRLARIYPWRAHDEWLWWADLLFIGR